jgi:hypothetical protein
MVARCLEVVAEHLVGVDRPCHLEIMVALKDTKGREETGIPLGWVVGLTS